MKKLSIIGGGLSGCEAAWQAAERGILVSLYEMRPYHTTGAHQTDNLAELVCSNSLGSQLLDRSSGLLINELEILNSLLIRIAKSCTVPAGHALAIAIPSSATIIASGPLTSDSLAESIKHVTNHENLFFFDAIAPIIEFESINMNIAFWGSRYGKGFNKRGDYINCPFDESTYELFITELVNAKRIELRKFEKEIPTGVRAGKGKFFEGCLPIEIMAERGFKTLAFGPLRPVGLTNPHNGNRSYAIVQLRQDDLEGNFFNIVGFQTNLKYSEQERVFRLIPGLENALFERHGQMHRNTFINSPESLNKYLQLDTNPNLFFCGQITGVEGYLANISSGLFAGINSARMLSNQEMVVFPPTTMLGALNKHVINKTEKAFQPMKANFGLLPVLIDKIKPKRERYKAYSDRAIKDLKFFLDTNDL